MRLLLWTWHRDLAPYLDTSLSPMLVSQTSSTVEMSTAQVDSMTKTCREQRSYTKSDLARRVAVMYTTERNPGKEKNPGFAEARKHESGEEERRGGNPCLLIGGPWQHFVQSRGLESCFEQTGWKEAVFVWLVHV